LAVNRWISTQFQRLMFKECLA